MRGFAALVTMLFTISAYASAAPGAPGIKPTWSDAKKVQIGSSFHDFKKAAQSYVWFSLSSGVLTETYFPTIDKAQIKDSQILILTKDKKLIEERKEMIHETKVLSPSLVKLINKTRDGKFEIHHTLYTADKKNMVVDSVEIIAKEEGAEFYLLTNSALKNSGLNDNAEIFNGGFKFFEDDYKLLVKSSVGFETSSVGFVGISDGYQMLKKAKRITSYSKAINGNVAGVGKLRLSSKAGNYKFYITYEFGNKQFSLSNSVSNSSILLDQQKEIYEKNWRQYFESLKQPKLDDDKFLFYRSMYVLKTHEDKLNPGAMIASLSVPWGEEMIHQEGMEYGGYHLIWPRDLFHVSLAALYSGDQGLALRALKFLKSIQYKSGVWSYGDRVIPKFGAFPQNVWTNKEEYWGGLQLDQVAYPVHLFWHLYENSPNEERKNLLTEFEGMLKDALDFIVRYGPWSGQERWEENFGISPSSFSAAASALLLGEKIFGEGKYKNIAHQWLHTPNDNIHRWTFTTNGVYGDGNYYLRVGGCSGYIDSWLPNENQNCYVANSGRIVDQKEMLDQGFLKLTLFGLVSPLDWRIQTSFHKIKEHIRVYTPKGPGHYRYSYDAYGENGQGRLWPLLNGEQGRYFIEQALVSSGEERERLFRGAVEMKETFKSFKNVGSLIPEQVFEDSGQGTGGATPLAWSHAEYIKLMWSLEMKKNIANPTNN